jgi:HSP20 family protein
MLLPYFSRLDWDPFVEMRRMQNEMNRLLDEFEAAPVAAVFPPINIWVGENSAVVTAELPGVSEKDIDLSVREDTLTIRGKREPETSAEEASWHRRERVYGDFSRVVELPFRVDPDRVQARFLNGVLEVELQRPDADKPKRIKVTAH